MYTVIFHVHIFKQLYYQKKKEKKTAYQISSIDNVFKQIINHTDKQTEATHILPIRKLVIQINEISVFFFSSGNLDVLLV